MASFGYQIKVVPPRLECGENSDHGMNDFISTYESYRKLMAKQNAQPLGVLVNEQLLGVVWDEDLEKASAEEVKKDDLRRL